MYNCCVSDCISLYRVIVKVKKKKKQMGEADEHKNQSNTWIEEQNYTPLLFLLYVCSDMTEGIWMSQ